MEPNTMLEAALYYAKRGWPVFPVAPNRKVPLIPGSHGGQGCKDATVDASKIIVWWKTTPQANIGLATGKPGPDVLDIDVKKGAPGLQSLRKIAAVHLTNGSFWSVSTPSGGYHLYYPGTTQSNARANVLGLDFRGMGGYVLAPPSRVVEYNEDGTLAYDDIYRIRGRAPVTYGRPVSWVAIRNYLKPPKVYTRPGRLQAESGADDDCQEIIDFMSVCQEGGRNDTLFWCANQLKRKGCERWNELESAAVTSGLPLTEIESIIGRVRGH